MSVIHLYVHGRGRGHGSRCLAVTEHLESSGHQVRVFAGPGALEVFGSGKAEAITSMMPGDGLRSGRILRERMGAARDAARGDGAEAIISDGDLPGALAARLAGIPAIALGHGLVFSHTRRPSGLPAAPWFREAAKAHIASVGTTRQVAVNFVPMEPRSPSTTVACPVLRPELRRGVSEGVDGGGDVICYFRDSNGQEALGHLVSAGITPRLFATEDPRIDGVEWEALSPQTFTNALLSARAVVSSAGSQLISECVALGLPQLSLFDPEDDEQRLNVAMLRSSGLGDGYSLPSLKREDVHGFIDTLDSRRSPRGLAPWGPDAAHAVEQALLALL